MFKKSKQTESKGRRAAGKQPSKNQAVFSYYQNRDTEFDARQSRDRPSVWTRVKSRLQHLPTLIAGLMIIASAAWALSLSSTPKITVVNEQNVASSAILRPLQEYQKAAQKLFNNSPLNKVKLTLDTKAIEEQLEEQFLEITNVAVVLPIMSRTPIVYVQVAEPVLVLENGGQQFVIDEKGRAVIAADQVSDLSSLGLIQVKDAATLALKPGGQVLTGHDVGFMRTVRDQLAAKGLSVARIELPARAGEANVYIAGKPYYVKFTTTADALQQVGTYLAANQYLEGKKTVPAEYIDVRVEERVYYK